MTERKPLDSTAFSLMLFAVFSFLAPTFGVLVVGGIVLVNLRAR